MGLAEVVVLPNSRDLQFQVRDENLGMRCISEVMLLTHFNLVNVPCSVQVVKLLPEQAFSPTGPPLYYLFNFILILLLVLHVYWWILIAKVIYRQIAGSGLDDVRSGESTVHYQRCVADEPSAYILHFCWQCR